MKSKWDRETKGSWASYIAIVVVLHLFLLALPFFTTAQVWTLTNLLHNLVTFFLLHVVKGDDDDGGRRTTIWEQIDGGEQLTVTRKFLSIIPVLLFLLTSIYTEHCLSHFVSNFGSLVVVVVAKLPCMHRIRLLGINKY